MLKVGVTGGIGSGKTVVCTLLNFIGISVLDSDALAKDIMITDQAVIQKIKQLFGEHAYHDNGSLNRALLSDQIYKRSDLLERLNAIIHPAVRSASNDWFESHINEPYAIKEAALIFETGLNKTMDFVIGVTASEVVRKDRVMKRSGLTEQRIEAIMHNQPFANKLEEHADFILRNNQDELLIPQVVNLHRNLTRLALEHKHSISDQEEE